MVCPHQTFAACPHKSGLHRRRAVQSATLAVYRSLHAPVLVAWTERFLQIPLFVAQGDEDVAGKAQGEEKMTHAHVRRGPRTEQNTDVHRVREVAIEKAGLHSGRWDL